MAGSREAHALVTALLSRRRRVIASLPEPERMFGALPVPTRVGGFASPSVLEAWLDENHVVTVLDASHSFDSDISKMVSSSCTRKGLKYIRILRPPWQETHRDRWQHFSSIARASEAVPKSGRAFTNTGRLTLPDYANFAGRKLFMRQTRDVMPVAPFPFVEFIEGQPPFSQFQEQDLFRELGVTHLICRNVGGAASMSKILAARLLQIPVLMVARPSMPVHLTVVETITEALAWEANV